MSGICKANQRQSTRHKIKYQLYRNAQRRESNKLKKLMRTLKKQPMNNQLLKCLVELAKMTPLHAKTLKIDAFLTNAYARRRALTR